MSHYLKRAYVSNLTIRIICKQIETSVIKLSCNTFMLNNESLQQESICLNINNRIYLCKTEIETSESNSLWNPCMLNQVPLLQESICLKRTNRIHFAQNRNRDPRKHFHCGIHVCEIRSHYPKRSYGLNLTIRFT